MGYWRPMRRVGKEDLGINVAGLVLIKLVFAFYAGPCQVSIACAVTLIRGDWRHLI